MSQIDNIQQVGGNHYGTGKGHWDYCKAARTPYLEGAATKYLFRWRKKNGLEDLKKGFTFLEKLMYGMTVDMVNIDPFNQSYLGELEDTLVEQNVPSTERLIIEAILSWRTYADLLWAENAYKEFIEQVEAEQADGRYTNQG